MPSSIAVSYSVPCVQKITFCFWFLHAAEPPRITSYPSDQKDAFPGKPVTFSIQATGTEPINYQWQHKTRDGNEEWQSCDVECFPGANTSTLTISSVQKLDEGSYRCVISNCVGSQTSEPVKLCIGKAWIYISCMQWASFAQGVRQFNILRHTAKPPRITAHPQELKNAAPGKSRSMKK